MLKVKRVSSWFYSKSNITKSLTSSKIMIDNNNNNNQHHLINHCPSQLSSYRFLDFYQIGNKDAIEKERARLTDEMNRGYFADISEMKKHGGKIATANKIIIPAMAALKFPELEVNYSDSTTLRLPITSNKNDIDAYKSGVPKATLLCLSFRASSQAWKQLRSSVILCKKIFNDANITRMTGFAEKMSCLQAMVDSWSIPFLEAFCNSDKVNLFEVSLIDSWLLSRSPIKRLLLRMMRKSKPNERNVALQRQIVYTFGDHYYLRKELKILNLITGYIFLLDNFGRIRWQGSGSATQDEISSLLSCTSLLLEEEKNKTR